MFVSVVKSKFIAAIGLSLVVAMAYSQTNMRVHRKSGTFVDIPISDVDSVTFVGDSDRIQIPNLTGSWLWGDYTKGYYELLTFNEDYSYIGYDSYFTYGLETYTYGWYSYRGTMLTLQSNGLGYRRRYDWFVMALTDNALDVMTKMGNFVYYKLQDDVIYLEVGGESLKCEPQNSFVFADGCVVKIENNDLVGVVPGTTYIQKYIAEQDVVIAFKVVVID